MSHFPDLASPCADFFVGQVNFRASAGQSILQLSVASLSPRTSINLLFAAVMLLMTLVDIINANVFLPLSLLGVFGVSSKNL